MSGTTSNTKLLVIITFLTLAILWYHIGHQLLYSFYDADHWITYYDIRPIYPTAQAGTEMKYVSVTTVQEPASLDFLEILYCEDPMNFKLERYAEQSTSRGMTEVHPELETIWPLSPLPPYETRCCTDHYITINKGKDYEKVISFSGCEREYYFDVIK